MNLKNGQTMANKKTAVEWLQEEYDNSPEFILTEDDFQKAKEMEKEQTIEFANKVLYNAECSFTGIAYLEKDINEIYKETYENHGNKD